MDQTINAILPVGEVVVLSTGREQKINPFKFYQFGEVMNAIKGMSINMLDGDPDVLGLVMNHYKQIAEAVRIATGWDETEVKDLYIDDMMLLVFAIIRVNQGFFVQCLVPKLQDMTKDLKG